MKMEEKDKHKEINGILITTTERKLGEYEFVCKKCGSLHTQIPYAVAQLAMGNPLIFSCSCGNKINLNPKK